MNIFLIAIAICIGVASSATIPQETESATYVEGTVNFKMKNNPDGTVELDISGWKEAIDAIAGGHDSKFYYHLYIRTSLFFHRYTHPSNPLLLTLLQLVYVKLHVDKDYEYDGDGDVPLGMVRGELVKDKEEEEEEEKTSVSRELARTRADRNTFYKVGGKSSKSKYYMGDKSYSSKSSKSKSSKSKSSKSGGRKKKGRNRKNRKRRYPWE